MRLVRSEKNETCVIGELTDRCAFASVSAKGEIWAKQYPDLHAAVTEARRLGVIDRLFATVAPKYIHETRQNCISPVAHTMSQKQLQAAGFRQINVQVLIQGLN